MLLVVFFDYFQSVAGIGQVKTTSPPEGTIMKIIGMKKRVGDYELLEVLGEGTFATVRSKLVSATLKYQREIFSDGYDHLFAEARHKSGKLFAVKCLDKRSIEKNRMGKQLKREIAIMRIIKHPRVVEFHEVLASKSKIYLVLEVSSWQRSSLCPWGFLTTSCLFPPSPLWQLVTGGELFE